MSDHDNDTCPHLVLASLLEAENAHLKTENEELHKDYEALADEHTKLIDRNAILKALTERMNDTINLSQAGCRQLKAEVERLNDLIISGGAVNPDASVYTE